MKNKKKFTQGAVLFLFLLILCSLHFLVPHKYDFFIARNNILDIKINNNNKTLSLTQNTQIEDVRIILNHYTYRQKLLKEIDYANKMNLTLDLDNSEISILDIYTDNIIFFNGKRYKVINKDKTNLYTELNTYLLSLTKTTANK